MMLPEDPEQAALHVRDTYRILKERHRERDDRMAQIAAAVGGDFDEVDPDNEQLIVRSPNLIQVALEDTAEAAGSMPTIRVMPRRPTAPLKALAGRMERIASGYLDFSQMELMVPATVMDMAAYGLAVWVAWPDYDERLPVIEQRNPRTCYPEPGFRPGQAVRRCLFARQVHYSQLPPEYQAKVIEFVTDERGHPVEERLDLVLVELFTEEEVLVTAVFDEAAEAHSVLLDRWPNKAGACQVVIGSRITLDKEFRGQFDQVIGTMSAHVRLMAMVLDYADQSVYSDVWVKDLIGEMPWGGGGYIELGPNGAIGRVPPAVTSLNVQQDLVNLVDAIHVGGRWPKSRPGEIDQAIASAKFVEATAGMLNTAIKTYHQIIQRMIEHALRLSFLIDQRYFPGPKTVSGILRNQEFVEEYDSSKDIDVKNRIRAEYGLGLGRDPAQSAVLMLGYQDKGLISSEFVQENIEGLTDVSRERIRIDVEQLQKMLLADLLNGLQTGTLPKAALLDIIEARQKGEDIISIARKYLVPPEEPEHPAIPGLPAPPGPAGALPPGAPPLLPPPPPEAGALLARIGVPAGNSQSFASVSVR